MAVKRTGTVFVSKKTPLKWMGLFFEKIGKPFYWLVLGLVFFIGYLLNLLIKIFFWLLQQIKKIHLPKFRRPKFKKPKIKPKVAKKPKVLKVKIRPIRIKISPRKLAFILISLLFLSSIFYLLFSIFYRLPNPNQLITREQVVTTKIYDRNGQLLYKSWPFRS